METAATDSSNTGFLTQVLACCAKIKDPEHRRNLFAQTAEELERLTDEQLQTIGVARDEILQSAYECVHGQYPLGLLIEARRM